ncbi:hypothetical protein R3P38DRAFT_2502523 [Favolaschia claudopus]|uniref:F-box domain-containing protein n=1 Tax=Favolaschia claudopus TaxID=2862362 RepID=A0AAW0DIF3_9AGAR
MSIAPSIAYVAGDYAVDRQWLALRYTLQALDHKWRNPNSPTYPILSLPNEILSEIFLHFLPSYPEFPPLSGPCSPMRLLQICRKWRAIALATPAIWSIVTFLVSTHPETVYKSEARLNESRASALPLSLRIVSSAAVKPTPWSIPELPPFVGISEYDCARVEHLRLDVHGSHLPAIQDRPMPVLERLELWFQAPLLRTVVLELSFPMTINLPWEQLTSLTINAFNVEASQALHALRRAVNLKHCVLDFQPNPDMFLYTMTPDPYGGIIWPALESLAFGARGFPGAFGRYLLDALLVPSLRSLQVPLPYLLMTRSQRQHIDYIRCFVRESGCELKALHVTHVKLAVGYGLWQSQVDQAIFLHAEFPDLEVCTMT